MNLKKKHQDAIQEMSEQIDQLTKMKSKIEKDKGKIALEANDARAATEEVSRAKGASEKSNKVLAASLNDLGKKVEEANMTIGDFENGKRKLAVENADLLRQLGELENQLNLLSKTKIQLVFQLEECKKAADDEARDRLALSGKFKNLEHLTKQIKIDITQA
jgi:chaperonin cofactor prefoldin